ncbi:hypothetical protein LSUE1_G006375 [Lachnellula suecica]|uniref:DUF7728 domain-containing protein n=1 Tax=Lachnellula suecica TaxID=602035 RepID=A0A8T9C1F1_9HELO|nr:hypothetical protein LSUE1_G006375 [Lachnellula suecica]
MRFSRLNAVAALVGVNSAFLLPPPMTSEINALPFEDGTATDGRVMELSCPGCPVEITDIAGKVHSTDAQSVLKLNISISHDGADRLLLNGLPLYPIDPSSEAFMIPLTADQLVKNEDNTWSYVSTPTLGYSLSVKHPVPSNDESLDLVAIHIEIVEVANKFLGGIPSVELKLLQTPSGQLMLGDAEITTPKSAVSEPTDGGQECTTIVCKWRAIIADRLSKLKGCGSKRPAHAKGPKHHGHKGQGRPHGRPHGHRPFRHHRHRHSLGRLMRNIAIHVLIPIFIGIVVGITASLVGVVVGNVAIFFWRLLFRRNTAQYTKVAQIDIVAEEGEDDKEAFLEPPPSYEEKN